MKFVNLILTALMTIVVTGCVSTITAPESGPTAYFFVNVINFDDGSGGITNVENVYFDIHNTDKSWGGQQLIKRKQPEYSFVVPANERLTASISLSHAGVGFSSNCGVDFNITPPENTNFTLDFEFIRKNDSIGIIGCVARLYSGSELIGTYEDSTVGTIYK